MADHGVLPTGMATLFEAMSALNGVDLANVRGWQADYYRASEIGLRELRLVRCTPHPVAFELGVVTGLARRHKPADAVRLYVEIDPLRPPESQYKTTFRITW